MVHSKDRCRYLIFFYLMISLLSCKGQFPNQIELGDSVVKAAELTTVEFVYHDIIFVKEQKRFIGIPISKREVLFSVNFTVEAGIDLKKEYQVKADGDVINVYLPSAEVFTIDADEKSLNEYYSKYFGSKVSLLFYYDEINRQKESIQIESIKRGILEQSEQRLSDYLKLLYYSAGFKIVNINFKEHSEEVMAETPKAESLND